MKILIMKNTKALGDCLLALPMLERFKELMGDDAFLGLLLHEKNREIALSNPFIDELFIWRETFSGSIRTIKELRKYSWDVCIDLQGLFLNALIALLSGCKRRITLSTSLGDPEKVAIPFYSSIVELPPGLHAATESDMLAYFLSREFLEKRSLPRRIKAKIFPLPGNEFRPHIYLSSDEVMKASRLVEGIEPFIALCPGTPNRIKQWSAEKWARIANEIGRRGYGVVIIGSETDAPIVNEIKGGIDVPFLDLTGKTTIREAGGVISLARLVISIDNGAMHLASAVDTPVLALFGPTSPKYWGPCGEEHRIIYKSLPCSPCNNPGCETRQCMEAITAEDVLSVLSEMLE